MTRKGVRLCGTTSQNVRSTGKILRPVETRKLRAQTDKDLANRLLAIDEDRMAFDCLREPDDNPWEDVDTMDIDNILDGTVPIDLSHEGGEFSELVEDCIKKTVP